MNTLAAEVLYNTVKRLTLGEDAATVRDITLLDVCCGTGTIGLTMAKRVTSVSVLVCLCVSRHRRV